MKREFLRKAVHTSGILFIPVLLWDRNIFAILFTVFLVTYLVTEQLGKKGHTIPFLTSLVTRCKRPEEGGHLSRGAIFLALSGIITPYLYGSEVAAIGLCQTFVADTVSTFVGMKFGKRKLPYSKNKSWIGSLAFFLSATFVSLFFVPLPQAFFLGFFGTLTESLPVREVDNFSVPLVVGGMARFIL